MKAKLIDHPCVFCGERRLFVASVIVKGKSYHVCVSCFERFDKELRDRSGKT